MVDPVVDLTCMMLTLDPPWAPNLSNSAYVCMPINSISFTRDFSLAPYMPDSSMANYTFMFIMERSISTTLDTGSLSNSVLSSTTMCKLDTWDPATTRPCYSMLRELYCLLSTSISPTTRLLDPSCRLDEAVLCLRKVSVPLVHLWPVHVPHLVPH
jgi:hypothetical protein